MACIICSKKFAVKSKTRQDRISFSYIFNLEVKSKLNQSNRKELSKEASLLELESIEYCIDCFCCAVGINDEEFKDIFSPAPVNYQKVCAICLSDKFPDLKIKSNVEKEPARYFCIGCFKNKFGNQVLPSHLNNKINEILLGSY